jgi:hypothetical protein
MTGPTVSCKPVEEEEQTLVWTPELVWEMERKRRSIEKWLEGLEA